MGHANGYPLHKAKLHNKLDAYVGFSPKYMILAKRLPPIPGGWDVTVESYEPEERIIPLNVKPETGEINRFIVKMIDEYVKEGLEMELSDKIYESYGTHLRDLKVVGHPSSSTTLKILLRICADFLPWACVLLSTQVFSWSRASQSISYKNMPRLSVMLMLKGAYHAARRTHHLL